MRGHIRDLYLLIMYLIALSGIVILIVTGVEVIWGSLLFSVCWLMSFSTRNLLFYSADNYRKMAFVTYILEIVLVTALGAIGADGIMIRLLLCLTLADCFMEWGKGYGAICLALIQASIVFQQMVFHQANARGVLLTVLHELPILALVALVSYLVGRVLSSSKLLESTMKDVQEREVKLRIAYQQLGEAYKSLEEMATVKERNRIAREIHDTVGHTLTTVIVELEAGRMLSKKDPIYSGKKYEMAHQQAVKALNDLRRSVRMLREGPEERSLQEAMEDVLEETARHTEVAVRYTIDLPKGIKTSQDDLLIRALKEGLSNGIRHGRSTAFFFQLHMKDGRLNFLLQDNGTGCEKIAYGFGLDNMKRDIEHVGGCVTYRTAKDEGFDIEMEIPVEGRGA